MSNRSVMAIALGCCVGLACKSDPQTTAQGTMSRGVLSGGMGGTSASTVGGAAGMYALPGAGGADMRGLAGVGGVAGVTGSAGRASIGGAGVGFGGGLAGVGGSGTAGRGTAGVGGGTAGSPPNMPPPLEACNGTSTLMPGAQQSVMLGNRTYLLRVGKSVKAGQAAALVLNLHGLNMTPQLEEQMTGMTPVADSNGFIVAYPGFAPNTSWDGSGTADFDFMKAIIADVSSKICVDHKRIYAMGFSAGAFFSFAIGCKMSDIIAAIAPHSGGGGGACNTTRPVPVFAWHGDADPIVAYSSGQSAVTSWVTKDKCPSTPTMSMEAGANCQDWNPCDKGTEVKFCTIPGGGHTFTRGASPLIWNFFSKFSLP